MKYLLLVIALGLPVVGGCGKTEPKPKKVDEDEAKRKAAAEAAALARLGGTKTEELHKLPEVPQERTVVVEARSVVVVKVARNGVIETVRYNYPSPGVINVEKGGAQAASGCCSDSEAPEVKSMAGQMKLLSMHSKVKDGDPCNEPVLLDGDYKAPWSRVRKVLEIMANVHMTRLVIGTSAQKDRLAGLNVKLPVGWKATDPVPAAAKVIRVGVNGADLVITVDGKACADVGSAITALQGTGAKEFAIHPTDQKVPLWAVARAIEAVNAVSPTSAVHFVMTD